MSSQRVDSSGWRGELRGDVVLALERAIAFLQTCQLPDGELPTYVSPVRDMSRSLAPDSNYFATALALHGLSHCKLPAAVVVRERAIAFLRNGKGSDQLWRFWTRKVYRPVDSDVDVVACVAAALRDSGTTEEPGPVTTQRLVASLDAQGRFPTWLRPCGPNDVDIIVNANALWLLRGNPRVRAAAEFVSSAVLARDTARWMQYYDEPAWVNYAVSRALCAGEAALGACATELARTAVFALSCPGLSVLPLCLYASTLLNLDEALGQHCFASAVHSILQAQLPTGAWPIEAVWNGPEQPLPRSMWWGSPALTSAFAVEVLARVSSLEL